VDAQNLLIIMADEHNPNMLGAAGHGLVETPNLDALAERGTQFSNAYTNCPICVPARASFATGRYVHDIGYWDNSMGYDGRVQGWGHRLQTAGMRVESIGKLHYRLETDDVGLDRQHIPMHIKDGVGMLHLSIRQDFVDALPTLRPNGIIGAAGPGESEYTRYDRKIAALACDWLAGAAAKPADKPWVLFVSFVTPHYPLVAPEEFFELYDLDDMPPPKCSPGNGFTPHPWHQTLLARTAAETYTQTQHRTAAAAYLALCSFVDAQVGLVLAALRRHGFAENTRIIYTSDHGENAGARGMWGKSNHYEEASGVPLIIAGQDVPVGKVCATPTTLVDVHPAVLQATGLPHEKDGTPGRSLFDIADASDDPDRVAFSEYHAAGSPSGSFMVRKGNYKYIHYVNFEPELFDLHNDPEEVNDVAGTAPYAEIQAELESTLRHTVSPEGADATARAAQAALIESHGGVDAVRNNLVTTKHYTPVPDALLE